MAFFHYVWKRCCITTDYATALSKHNEWCFIQKPHVLNMHQFNLVLSILFSPAIIIIVSTIAIITTASKITFIAIIIDHLAQDSYDLIYCVLYW